MKKTVLFLIIAMAAFGVYANGSSEVAIADGEVSFTVETMDFQPIRTITVEPTDEILAVFENYGIDSSSLVATVYEDEEEDDDGELTDVIVLPTITQEVNSEVALILQENRDNVVDLIQAELQSKLHRGGTEEATMNIAAYSFSAALDYPQA